MGKLTLRRLFHHAESEYHSFLNALKKLDVAEYPTRACRELIEELTREVSRDLDNMCRYALSALRDNGNRDYDLDIDYVRNARSKLNLKLRTYRYLDWIQGAQTQRVPWSLIPAVERLALSATPEHRPILYCESEYNYRIVWWLTPTKKLEQYCFISLPRLHRTNVLMHGLLAHELFHPCARAFVDRWRIDAGIKIARSCSDLPEYVNSPRPDQIVEGLRRMWERILEELLCDMFCAEICGPALLFAMRAYAAFSDWRAVPSPDNNFYPPWQYRFEVVWKKAIDKDSLERLFESASSLREIRKIADLFKTEVTGLGALSEGSKGEQVFSVHPFIEVVFERVDALIDEATQFVRENFPGTIRRWSDEKVLQQVPYLVKRLKNGVPPNEISTFTYDSKKRRGAHSAEPAALPAILIAGWMYQVYRENASDLTRGRLWDYDTLSRLLLKAIDDSEMLCIQRSK